MGLTPKWCTFYILSDDTNIAGDIPYRFGAIWLWRQLCSCNIEILNHLYLFNEEDGGGGTARDKGPYYGPLSQAVSQKHSQLMFKASLTDWCWQQPGLSCSEDRRWHRKLSLRRWILAAMDGHDRARTGARWEWNVESPKMRLPSSDWNQFNVSKEMSSRI